MIIVVDANIAAALFLDLAYSAQARDAVMEASVIIAPDLITAEVANTLWKLVHFKHIDMGLADHVLDGLTAIISEFVPGARLAVEAVKHASALGHPAYDCFYLTLARRRRAKLITADSRFAAALERVDPPVDYKLIAA
jgi:predicted nucleic acid-binding protein